jgi:FkbM family methyltransferase
MVKTLLGVIHRLKNTTADIRRVISMSIYERRRYLLLNKQIERSYLTSYIYQKLLKFNYFQNDLIFDISANLYYNKETDIGYSLFYWGKFEEKEIQIFNNMLQSKSKPVILDIGANIGCHCIRWAKSNPTALLYAFEPSPSTRDILERNIKNNKVGNNIKALPFAVSNQTGKASFYNCIDNAYSSLKDTKRKIVEKVIDVDMITIDKFVENFKVGKIDLIKIDVEGFENEVIEGGVNSLRKFKPDLFVEIYQGTNSNEKPEKTIEVLLELGYNAYVLNDGKIEKYSYHSDSYYNYYFTFENTCTT